MPSEHSMLVGRMLYCAKFPPTNNRSWKWYGILKGIWRRMKHLLIVCCLKHKKFQNHIKLKENENEIQKFKFYRPYAYDITMLWRTRLGVNRITRKSSCQKCASRTWSQITSAYKAMALTPQHGGAMTSMHMVYCTLKALFNNLSI